MSAASEKIRKAIFAKSNVVALIGSGKFTAVYESKAPENAVRPYGIFSRQAPGEVNYTFGPVNTLESDLWMFKVVTDEDSSTTKEPQELAEDLLILWESTLGTELTLTGNTVTWMSRFADIPPTEECRMTAGLMFEGF